MAYEYKVVYARPNLDVDWPFFDTTISSEEDARGDAMTAWVDAKIESGDITRTVWFAEDQLSVTISQRYADEAAYNAIVEEWESYVASDLGGIRPLEEASSVNFAAQSGCSITTSFGIVD